MESFCGDFKRKKVDTLSDANGQEGGKHDIEKSQHETRKIKVQIVLDKDYNTFSIDDEENFLKALSNLMKIDGLNLKVVSVAKGSVILTIEMSLEVYEKLKVVLTEETKKDLKILEVRPITYDTGSLEVRTNQNNQNNMSTEQKTEWSSIIIKAINIFDNKLKETEDGKKVRKTRRVIFSLALFASVSIYILKLSEFVNLTSQNILGIMTALLGIILIMILLEKVLKTQSVIVIPAIAIIFILFLFLSNPTFFDNHIQMIQKWLIMTPNSKYQKVLVYVLNGKDTLFKDIEVQLVKMENDKVIKEIKSESKTENKAYIFEIDSTTKQDLQNNPLLFWRIEEKNGKNNKFNVTSFDYSKPIILKKP